MRAKKVITNYRQYHRKYIGSSMQNKHTDEKMVRVKMKKKFRT